MPDAAEYGDAGTDTMGHISESVDEFHIPNLQKLGIANLHPLKQVAPIERPMGYYSFLKEASTGKDTMTGHWEMMGLHITKPFKTFTETGFPKELIDELEKRTGHKVIGNKSASGTVILDELGEEEIATGHMIVYTSADSVLQICGNEETFGLDELYRCCEIARKITMKDEWKVGRVIARPYVGKKKGEFVRTSNRHDYALKPYGRTALNALKDGGYEVISVGKIFDIFDGEGLTQSNKSKSSVHGMEQTIDIAKKDFDWAVETASKKKKMDCSGAEFLSIDEGLCVQIMHIGAFDDEPATVAMMDKYLEENGYVNDFTDERRHHEIYLSDPRKVAPEKCKTVIRHPIKKA